MSISNSIKLTQAQTRALTIVRDHPGIRPREFAKLMWPESEGWSHHVKCGSNGSHKGGGMPLAGGGYLGKLMRLKLIRNEIIFSISSHQSGGYFITLAGERALENNPT